MSTLHIVFFVIAFLISTFFFWRQLRADYESEKIFTLSLFTLIATVIFSILFLLTVGKLPQISFYVNTTLFWFWPMSMAFFLTLLFAKYKFTMKPFEVLEASVLAFLYFHISLMLFLLLFLPAAFFVLFLILFYWLKLSYKKISWYRSGRIGFASLTTAATLLLTRSIIAILTTAMLSLTGRADTLISAVIAFILFLNLYKLTYN